MVIRIARSETTNPNPKWPSMTVVVALSRRTLERSAGHDVALADSFDVDGDIDDPVRVVAGEIRRHAVPRDGGGFLRADAGRPKRPNRQRLEVRR